jgi:hypothetical protein
MPAGLNPAAQEWGFAHIQHVAIHHTLRPSSGGVYLRRLLNAEHVSLLITRPISSHIAVGHTLFSRRTEPEHPAIFPAHCDRIQFPIEIRSSQ